MAYNRNDIIRTKDDPRIVSAIGNICYAGDTLKKVLEVANRKDFYRTATEVCLLDGIGWEGGEDDAPDWIDRYPFRFKMVGYAEDCFWYSRYIIPMRAEERIYEPRGVTYAAFMNRKTGLLVGRTEKENGHVRQICRCGNPPIITDIWDADLEMKMREMNPRDYKPVRIRILIEDE